MILKATWYLFEVTPAIYTEDPLLFKRFKEFNLISLDMKILCDLPTVSANSWKYGD